jgi:hypothetical protein
MPWICCKPCKATGKNAQRQEIVGSIRIRLITLITVR